ncbi:MAG TPA: hypothetical protein V6D22_14900, partial [Candidatus Obscuribacterales bacterium]
MKKCCAALFFSVTLVAALLPVAAATRDSRQPRMAPVPGAYQAPSRPMDPKNVPDFAQSDNLPPPPDQNSSASSGASTMLRSDLQSATLPVQTRLKLVLEYPVDAKTSQPGDIFEAHVKDDLFLGRSLILPRGSLVRGRVSEITKPRLISRAAKIGLKLDQIVTPTGDIIPLDAALEFQKGVTNKSGLLDPGTNFGTRVEKNVRAVSGIDGQGASKGALIAANVATLGAPVIATAIGSSAIALFKAGDNVSLPVGSELEVML